jgi:hypothetical protein
MIVILVLTIALVAAGNLARVARLTDAMVLLSFAGVNTALTWLGVQRLLPGGAWQRARAIAISSAGALMCGWLLWHGGWVWIVAAGGVGVLGIAWLVAGRAVAGNAAVR